jgi:hypothetical protein
VRPRTLLRRTSMTTTSVLPSRPFAAKPRISGL